MTSVPAELARTALTSTAVFLLLKALLEPVDEMRKAIGEVAYELEYHAHIYSNPGTAAHEYAFEASKALRRVGCLMTARIHPINFWTLWCLLRLLPSKKDIREASAALIGISNMLDHKDEREFIQERREVIRRKLRLGK